MEKKLSSVSQFVLFSKYNKLMNQRMFDSASSLSSDELKKDRSAYFQSILGTLNHILVGDIIWLKRLTKDSPHVKYLTYLSEIKTPESLSSVLYDDLKSLRKEREKIDNILVQWVSGLSESDMSKCVSYTNMSGKTFNKPFSSLLNHLFLHQVHHRGQVTVLLSQSGVDFGDTDLIEMIKDFVIQ